ncbi:TPA: hypothetical protein ACGEYS_003549 [Kluyvera cryocrescens]
MLKAASLGDIFSHPNHLITVGVGIENHITNLRAKCLHALFATFQLLEKTRVFCVECNLCEACTVGATPIPLTIHFHDGSMQTHSRHVQVIYFTGERIVRDAREDAAAKQAAQQHKQG